MIWFIIVLYTLAALLPSLGIVFADRRARTELARHDPNNVDDGMAAKLTSRSAHCSATSEQRAGTSISW